MEKAREFDNILDECLDRVMKGQDIETILALYPAYAAELEPLLRTALDTRKAAAIKPRPEFRQRAGYEFQAAIRDMPPRQARNPFRWQVRWMAPVAIIMVLILGGGGTVVAASNAMPDSPLYRVKLATETVQLAFTRSDIAKAELYARFADKRVEEIIKMAEKGKTEQVQKVTERMDGQLIAMANLTSPGLETATAGDKALLMAPAATTVPATTVPAPTQTTTSLAGQSSITTPPPTTTEVSPPEIVTVPEPSVNRSGTQADGAGHENGNYGNNATTALTEREKLKNELTRKYEENLAALQDELDKAPEALKPALERAIEVLKAGYEESIANLEQAS
jgi:hypothetical protein